MQNGPQRNAGEEPAGGPGSSAASSTQPERKKRKSGRLRPKGGKNKEAATQKEKKNKKKRTTTDWDTRLEELRRYKAGHGHCSVPQKYSENKQLGEWAHRQRTKYRRRQEGKRPSMSDDQVAALEGLGFEWEPSLRASISHWETRLEELRQYKAEHGHCNVPQKCAENKKLGRFVHEQRTQYQLRTKGRKSNMSEERIAALESLGFEWVIAAPDWETRLEELRRYKSKHGTCNVPQQCSENKSLGEWLSYQRKQYRLRQQGKKSSMSDERVAALEGLDIRWGARVPADWEMRLEELRQFEAKHGHCNVPATYSENKKLGNWVHNQRKQYRLRQRGQKSSMSDDRIAALEGLGFKWAGASRLTLERCNELHKDEQGYGSV